jgi:transposase
MVVNDGRIKMENINEIEYRNLTREQRGYLISKKYEIKKHNQGYKVPAQFNKGTYMVYFNGYDYICNCPDCQIAKNKCKHIYALEFYIKEEIDREGNVTITKGVKVSYPQKWKAYDNAQTNEKFTFLRLLGDLCKNVEEPEYKFGRPKVPLKDMLFCSAVKVYSTFSLRRCMGDLGIAKEYDLISKRPCYSSIGHFLQKEELTPLLKELIELSATPLSSLENDFVIDSSGFSTSRFARYVDFKWKKDTKYRIWLKAHVISGAKTNIISSVEITEGNSADVKELRQLVKNTAQRFNVKEVAGDKAYSSRDNLNAVKEVGAVPYIPFKKNVKLGTRACRSAIWNKMIHYYLYKNDEFMEHYHKRSNAETVFHMIKTKFKDSLRSKTKTAQINELLCKVLCHNICVVIQEMSELNLKGEFIVEEKINIEKNTKGGV